MEGWQYEITPTAGTPNTGDGAETVLPDPVFCVVGGVFYEPISLTISLPDADLLSDTKIYITKDGSEPTLLSESGTFFTFDIDSTTIIRAKLIASNVLSSRSLTQSYIYHPRKIKLPILSIVSDSVYFYSDEYGILLGGNDDKTTNCYQGWRRPVNIEYLEATPITWEKTHVNQLGETAIGGNWTRYYPQKSLTIIF